MYRMRILKNGYFACEVADIHVGQRYAFRLNGKTWFPDPASQWQPEGVHQPSAVWRADDFVWTDQAWHGVQTQDLAIYELHVGTFTPAGTFDAIIPRLRELRELGITALELMPVGQFPGNQDWGYDGAYWFAVQHSYGGPTELQRLVDACHAQQLAVILDVIYNHLGPEGNYLQEYGPFFTSRHQTPWGAGINCDGPSCRAVRDFVLANVRQWIRDFHMDGFRLDAVHAIQDDSPKHILAEIKEVALEEGRIRGVPVHVIAESNLNDVKLLVPTTDGGFGLDAVWNDDFHHCVHVLLTNEQSGYYADYTDPARQLVQAINNGFVYDGCYSQVRGYEYGTSSKGYPADRFIVSIQTHDQVGNRALGDRLISQLDWPKQRLAAGLLLLSPYIPMLFMGEEYGETRPFPFFCDFSDEALIAAVRRGRQEEFASFGWTNELPDPTAPTTFESAILSWSWPDETPPAGLRRLYTALLSLRRSHPALRDVHHRRAELYSGKTGGNILLLNRGDADRTHPKLTIAFNLGSQIDAVPSESRPRGRLVLFSEDAHFGGSASKYPNADPLPPYSFAVFENPQEVGG